MVQRQRAPIVLFVEKREWRVIRFIASKERSAPKERSPSFYWFKREKRVFYWFKRETSIMLLVYVPVYNERVVMELK